MNRPSKKEIKASVDKLKNHGGSADIPEQGPPPLSPKKPNKNRIRKQGV